MDSVEANKFKKKKAEAHSYKMHTFLEYESKRLSKILDFYDTKVLGLKSYPQSLKIETELEGSLHNEKENLIRKLKREKSPLSNNINAILKIHFKR